MKDGIAGRLLGEHDGVVQPKAAVARARGQGRGEERHGETERVVAHEVALGVARGRPALGPFGEAAHRLLGYVHAECCREGP